MTDVVDAITTALWSETPSTENPFVPEQCLCAGFDVYQDVLPKAQYLDYFYLLFKREQPTAAQRQLLNALAITLANAGPRDYAVQAAMSAAAGGSTQASCLISALAVGAGNFGGAREVFYAMESWQQLGMDLPAWQKHLAEEAAAAAKLKAKPEQAVAEAVDVWMPMEHPAGFDPRSGFTTAPVLAALKHFAHLAPNSRVAWLATHYEALSQSATCGLAFSGLAAAVLVDLEFEPDAGEMLFLLLRLPGAAAHALEQRERGWKDFPFYQTTFKVTNDPG